MSIEENELRVGNYLYDGVGGIIKVEVDDLYDNVRKFYKPIELIEEILLKCGFKKIDHHRFKIIPSEYEFYYTISVHDNCFRIYVGDSIICANVIFYLHQLQNLYFALTNQELEINL